MRHSPPRRMRILRLQGVVCTPSNHAHLAALPHGLALALPFLRAAEGSYGQSGQALAALLPVAVAVARTMSETQLRPNPHRHYLPQSTHV